MASRTRRLSLLTRTSASASAGSPRTTAACICSADSIRAAACRNRPRSAMDKFSAPPNSSCARSAIRSLNLRAVALRPSTPSSSRDPLEIRLRCRDGTETPRCRSAFGRRWTVVGVAADAFRDGTRLTAERTADGFSMSACDSIRGRFRGFTLTLPEKPAVSVILGEAPFRRGDQWHWRPSGGSRRGNSASEMKAAGLFLKFQEGDGQASAWCL